MDSVGLILEDQNFAFYTKNFARHFALRTRGGGYVQLCSTHDLVGILVVAMVGRVNGIILKGGLDEEGGERTYIGTYETQASRS